MTADPRALLAEGRTCLESMGESSFSGPDERATELAVRLVKPGPKAAHVSASECHEIAEAVLTAYSGEWPRCVAWLHERLDTLLDGYERALDEVEAKDRRITELERWLRDTEDAREVAAKASIERGHRADTAEVELERLRVENADLLKTQDRLVARIAATDSPADIEATLATLEAARSRIECLETELAGARKAADWLEAKRVEALAEIERITADRDHWREARRTAIEAGEVLTAEMERMRSELGEARLVIEQQDRDLERMRDRVNYLEDANT
jgi:chromosome segregation ATPase